MSGPGQTVAQSLASSVWFGALDREHLVLLEAMARRRQVAPGESVIVEGAQASSFYVIETGMYQAVRRLPGLGQDVVLHVLGKGQLFGEASLLEDARHESTVRALGPGWVLEIPYANLARIAEAEANPFGRILQGIARDLALHMAEVNRITMKALEREMEVTRARTAMGRFLVFTLLMMSGYSLAAKWLFRMTLTGPRSTLVTGPIILFFTGALVVQMRYSGFPLSTYGLTVAGWRRHVPQAIFWTAPVLAALVGVKWLVVQAIPRFAGQAVFTVLAAPFDPKAFAFIVLYALLTPIQELAARGALQSSLYEFPAGSERRRAFWSIVVSNALFAAFHLHLSIAFALGAFLPGLFWGALYARQRTLVGVSLSHCLVGVWALYVLGLGEVLKTLY